MRELLYKMLKTPSPSGSELNVQKLIILYKPAQNIRAVI